jgi:hypothetical protein
MNEMAIERLRPVELDDHIGDAPASEPSTRPSLTEIEDSIARVGARYVADLRGLTEDFARYYGAQLAAKDEQIAELRLELVAMERERESLQAQVRQVKQANTRHLAELRRFAEQFNQRLATAEEEARG